MVVIFYLSSAVAVAATILAVTRVGVVHALLYLIASLLAVAILFFTLGAPFAAALEVIIYAGAIMVLFVFVVMMLNLGERALAQEKAWLRPRVWIGPGLLALVLLGESLYVIGQGAHTPYRVAVTGPEAVGATLYGPYALAVELASLVLLAGLVGAFHLGRHALHGGPRDGERPQ
ncbi:MAG: NADH-quinone oxidoreductase subunit J [Betaproteobacteria bacterium]|nr:NADH-quinone oxidoreductase subunit J [Betaproteobacteria bacterium]